MLPPQICSEPFTNLTENFLILLVLPKSDSGLTADALSCSHFDGRGRVTKNLGFFKLALVLVRLDHVARFIVNADHGII